MKSLSSHLTESIGIVTNGFNNTDNNIRNTVDLIADNNIDEIIIQQLQPSTEDEELNKHLEELENSFQNVINRLESLGYVDIHGYRIQKRLTK